MSQTLDKLVKHDGQQSNLKNLYQNIGTRVSKLKEINEIYQQKMSNQNDEIVSFVLYLVEKFRRQNKRKRSLAQKDT